MVKYISVYILLNPCKKFRTYILIESDGVNIISNKHK